MCIRDFDFRLESIYAAPDAPQNIAHFNSGQKWLKNNHFTFLPRFNQNTTKQSVDSYKYENIFTQESINDAYL